jgi:hypothetical protein
LGARIFLDYVRKCHRRYHTSVSGITFRQMMLPASAGSRSLLSTVCGAVLMSPPSVAPSGRTKGVFLSEQRHRWCAASRKMHLRRRFFKKRIARSGLLAYGIPRGHRMGPGARALLGMIT